MALRWSWGEKCREIVVRTDTNERAIINLYEGNAFLIMLSGDEKGWMMYSFWADKEHAKIV